MIMLPVPTLLLLLLLVPDTTAEDPTNSTDPVKCPMPISITPDYGYGMRYPFTSDIPADSPGSTFSFFCARDFYIEPGDPFRKCQDNGSWSGVQHKCVPNEAARCPDPVLPDHSVPENPLAEYPIFYVLKLGCEEGWTGRGNTTVQCNYVKRWKVDFECKLPCPYPAPLPQHSLISEEHGYPDLAVDEVVPTTCQPGYHLLGIPEISCNSSHDWTFRFGCCPDPQTIENARNTYQKHPEYFFGPALLFLLFLIILLLMLLLNSRQKRSKVISTDMIRVKPAKRADLEGQINNTPPASKVRGMHAQVRVVKNQLVIPADSPYRKLSKENSF